MLHKIRSHHSFMWSYTRSLLSGLARPAFIFLAFLSATVMLLAAGVLYLIGPEAHFGVASFVDVLYFVVTTMSGVGYGDIVPKSHFAKFVSMGLMLLGTAIFVSFTATLSTVIMEIEFDIEKSPTDAKNKKNS
jgi:voltage-gated potassium channel